MELIAEKVDLKVGEKIFLANQHYAVGKKLGIGGFGTVYKVHDSRARCFALKVLDLWRKRPQEWDSCRQRFEQGYKAGLIDSDHLVRNLDLSEIHGNPCLLMDYCENGSLADRKQIYSDRAKLAKLSMEILAGLNDLHSNGVFHRDIKPENILFNKHYEAKLSDFDISIVAGRRVTQSSFWGRAKEVYGTLIYAPPEQLDPKISFKSATSALDIFSFGVLYYELITAGKLPYGAEEFMESQPLDYFKRMQFNEYVRLERYRPDLPVNLVNGIHACLNADYLSRPSALDLMSLFGNRSIDSGINGADYGPNLSLVIKNGLDIGKEYRLMELLRESGGDTLTLGYEEIGYRKNTIGIREDDTRFISRRHAMLSLVRDRWLLRDGQEGQDRMRSSSTNGTFLNNKSVSARGENIKSGDILVLGDTTLKVVCNK